MDLAVDGLADICQSRKAIDFHRREARLNTDLRLRGRVISLLRNTTVLRSLIGQQLRNASQRRSGRK